MTELKVGILALISIVGTVFMSLKVTQNQSGFGEHVAYRTIINDAAGIFPKTPIKVAGINAGRIKKIDLIGSQALITFEVQDKIKITKNSLLRIKSVGFLGDKYLDIYLGDPEAERLTVNEMIPSNQGGGLEDLTKDASEILTDVKAVMKRIREAVDPEDGRKPLKNIVNNIEDTTVNAKDLTASLKEIIQGNQQKIDQLVANLQQLTKNMSYETNAKNEDSVMASLRKFGPLMDEANKTMGDIKVIVGDVRNGKGTIGRLLRDDEIVDQVSETLSGVNRIVNRVNSLQTQLSIYTGYNQGFNSGAGTNVTELNLDLYPSPERYYRLGIVSTDVGPVNEKEISETVNGTTTTTTRKEKTKNTYAFNIQIGRKIQKWGFRAGLIESTGGIGVDYFFSKQGSILTLEAFDYREDLGLNVRLLSEIHMWNVFYLRGAIEDMISSQDLQSYTLSAGLRFTDEDLRGLIGFFL